MTEKLSEMNVEMILQTRRGKEEKAVMKISVVALGVVTPSPFVVTAG